ncbi:PAP2 superfamily-domain-containing protein [Lophiotrema nucula]|uniref:PAP2 superfamily-domain-containing protein n=1 Tax=Lophiotrema nucula TaxID=690887 RepID=A0A6A5Z2T6_9PLEO|nr:PAP2 superfamily-domain-containing protein [Lophiotrema nucula]
MPNSGLNYTRFPGGGDKQWNSKPAWKLPGWAEPVIVVTVLLTGMFMTRRRNYSILNRHSSKGGLLDSLDSNDSSEGLLQYDSDGEHDQDGILSTSKNPAKNRNCCGASIRLPNTSRFKNNIHSRILQKFPFLIEMFYWVINYAFYRFTSIASQSIFAKTGIWGVAQDHGLAVLEAEEFGFLSFLFPIRELNVQKWFMNGHQDALTVLNKAYALIHIPGTVGFLCWYYYVAPNFNTFSIVRRTMTLTNFMAFITFIFYPCMPPRLLPPEYGFLDTVRHDDAQSVWMSGKYVNTLAAMPSMHFGYSFCIGMTMIYHSGVFRRTLEAGEARKGTFWKVFYLAVGLGYPAFLLTTIVATANHYFMDALVATCFVSIAFYCNKVFYVFIPLEDMLLFIIRAEKPVPTTGDRFHERGGRI